MWKKVKDVALTTWDEVKLRLLSIFGNAKRHFERAFKGDGGIIRLAFDITLAVLLTAFVPLLAVGIAAANFTDEIDGFGVILSLTAAFVILELVAIFSLEIIAFLVAMQFSRISTRFLQNYKKRRDSENTDVNIPLAA